MAKMRCDKTAGGAINIAPGVEPLTTTVNAASGTYTFNGGPLAGTGTLTKSGNGNLSINADHTYSGGTIINSGQLTMEDQKSGALGTGPITLNGGTLLALRINTANPLTVNGGRLWGDGGWGCTFSGPVTLNGDLTVYCRYYDTVTISGNISGAGGLIVEGDATTLHAWIGVFLTGTNTYTGETNLKSGNHLHCSCSAALGTGALSIATGAKINLNYTGTRNIASLTLGGVTQTVFGTYGSTASPATNKDDTYFSGTGTVTVAGSSPYDTWANGTFANPFTAKLPTEDPDGDGQSNQQEFAFGLDPTTGSSVNPITQQLAGGAFKYTRTKESGLTYKVYYSTNLTGWTWDEFATQTPDAAVLGVETVTVTLAAAAPLDGKLFVRVEASPAP
jgi:autotransporter-associated beta strand protein